MRILYVHCINGNLGATIRASKIHQFLRKREYEVYEEFVDVNKLRMLLTFSKGLKRLFLSRKKDNQIKWVSPLEFLVSSSFLLIQEKILKQAMVIRPHIIIAETSLAGYLSLETKRQLNTPLVTDIHGLLAEETKTKKSMYANILEKVENATFQNSDYLITVSKAMKREISLTENAQEAKMIVVPNGGDILHFRARFNLPLRVIYAGNFAHYEKVNDYLEIAKVSKGENKFNFFLMGDGVQKREILMRIKKERISMNFLGLRNRNETLRLFSKMQVGIAPSSYGLEREVAFPIKVLDYMSCGLPIVAPKIGDWGDLIEKKNSGIVINRSNVRDYVDALYTLCNKKTWEEKSRNGKECIEKEYGWNRVLEPIGNLIEEIVT